MEFVTSANDLCDGEVGVTCVPASESVFAIGTTTVTCMATDLSGNTAECSFTVKVRSAAEMTENLSDLIATLDLDKGMITSLSAPLNQAIQNLDDGEIVAARNQLEAFINMIESQSGKAIDTHEANKLIAQAQAILSATFPPSAALKRPRINFASPLDIEFVRRPGGAPACILQWDEGILQRSDNFTDGWTDLPEVSSPYAVDVRGDRTQFFRVRYRQ